VETIEMKIGISLTGLTLLIAMTAAAQCPETTFADSRREGSPRAFVVRGQISSEIIFAGSWVVELVANGHSVCASTYVKSDGSFEFPSVNSGGYELRVTATGGAIVHHQNVMISGPEQNLSINIPAGAGAESKGGGTVSIRQLQHKVPSTAQKEFSKGMAASKKGDHQGAVDHFEKAVGIDPELADGYNNLGAAHAALGQLEQAAAQFQKAIDVVPDHRLALANLSVTLCKMQQYHEAELVARRALKLDSGLLKIRYILALSLAAQHRDSAEVLENLQRAAAEVPKARLVAADILAETGRRDDAARQLEEYLRAAPEQDTERQKVEAWLAQLRVQ
jgi:tetratricopeptide (TPR) repeat protein